MISFKPKQITKKLIMVLPERNRDIVLQRYGLGDSPEAKTLESIGQIYNITRERVRQLENFSLNYLRKHDVFSSVQEAVDELKDHIEKRGGIVAEENFLNLLSKDPHVKNHIYFFLVLADDFVKLKEDEEFAHRWTVDQKKTNIVHQILKKLHKQLSDDDLLSEEKIISHLKKHAVDAIKNQKINDEVLSSWLALSKVVSKNNLGEWGLVSSPNIKPRGMKDLAYLVIKKHGSPLHFNEVSQMIESLFERDSHPATVHNELIKDERFVLVGRGLYALGEWGYTGGVVRDVIKNILVSGGPLKKEEIIKRVLRERYVKDNTVLVNLQNREYFKRDSNGRYAIS